MNKQEIFNKVWKHFITDKNPRSVHTTLENTFCMYRGPDNTKCAVGVIISDDDYLPEMEYHSVDWLVKKYNLPGINSENETFLEELQSWHDSPPSDKKKLLKAIGWAYGLEIPE